MVLVSVRHVRWALLVSAAVILVAGLLYGLTADENEDVLIGTCIEVLAMFLVAIAIALQVDDEGQR